MECETIDRFNENGDPIFRLKKKYETLDDAIEAAKNINSKDTIIHKVVAYKCPKCYKYHIGRNGKELKEKERNKLKKRKKYN